MDDINQVDLPNWIKNMHDKMTLDRCLYQLNLSFEDQLYYKNLLFHSKSKLTLLYMHQHDNPVGKNMITLWQQYDRYHFDYLIKQWLIIKNELLIEDINWLIRQIYYKLIYFNF